MGASKSTILWLAGEIPLLGDVKPIAVQRLIGLDLCIVEKCKKSDGTISCILQTPIIAQRPDSTHFDLISSPRWFSPRYFKDSKEVICFVLDEFPTPVDRDLICFLSSINITSAKTLLETLLDDPRLFNRLSEMYGTPGQNLSKREIVLLIEERLKEKTVQRVNKERGKVTLWDPNDEEENE